MDLGHVGVGFRPRWNLLWYQIWCIYGGESQLLKMNPNAKLSKLNSSLV